MSVERMQLIIEFDASGHRDPDYTVFQVALNAAASMLEEFSYPVTAIRVVDRA